MLALACGGDSKLRAKGARHGQRAEASERLVSQIVNSLTAGLLVVDREGTVQIADPAGRAMPASPPCHGLSPLENPRRRPRW
jgi:hypothetical protein